MNRVALILLNFSLACLNFACVGRGTIKSDEALLLYDTSARLVGANVIVPVHGHVYEPYEGQVRSGLLRWVFENHFEELDSEKNSKIFNARIANFLVDNERGKRFKVCVRDFCRVVGKSEPNGRFENILNIPLASFESKISASHPVHNYSINH